MTKRRRNILTVLGVAVVLFVVLILVAGQDRRPEVRLAQVVLGNLVSTVNATGVVQPATEVQISSAVAGSVERLPVSEGDTVDRGDLLIQLEQQEFEAALQRAQAALDAAQSALAQSRTQFERARQLFEQELIAQQEFEAARAQYLADRARVREARANVEQARRQLDETTITSPLSGVVTELNVEEGEQVVPGQLNVPGTVLLTVANLSQMQVEAEVSESEVAKISVGQSAVIEVEAFAGRTFRGEVVEVGFSPETAEGAAEGAVNYSVSVGFMDTAAQLKPGMTAYADIVTARRDSVLMVPIQAVVTRPVEQLSPQAEGEFQAGTEVQAVFVSDNGVARLMPVKTGIAGTEYIQIESGVQRGQEVVVGPFEVLRELQTNTRVRI
ncbi:MAG: efflux RND transporter periplasmic adaptor subunit [Chitinispirillaceae bacterium]